jgi:hypothetical protein
MSDTVVGKIVIVALVLVAIILFFISTYNDSNVRVYDCGMAEWHPDIPIEVKEECRKIRARSVTNI